MKAIVTDNCRVAPSGAVTVNLKKGQEVTGELAQFCVDNGHAKEAKQAPKPEIKKTPKPKHTKPAKPDHEG